MNQELWYQRFERHVKFIVVLAKAVLSSLFLVTIKNYERFRVRGTGKKVITGGVDYFVFFKKWNNVSCLRGGIAGEVDYSLRCVFQNVLYDFGVQATARGIDNKDLFLLYFV